MSGELETPGAHAGGSAGEERPREHDGPQSSRRQGPTPADTVVDTPQHRVESDTTGGDTGDSAGDSSDQPPSSSLQAPGAAPARQPGERRSYDWPSIKRRYVEGVQTGAAGVMEWPSLDAVASHFSVAAQRVREKSAVEGWVEERNRWQAQVEATRRQARAAALSQNATELDTRAVETAKLGLQLCMTRLQEIAQRAQQRRTAGAGQAGGPDLGIDAQEQTRLAQAVDLWHKVGLRAIGDPETHRVEISGPNGRPIEIAQELRRDDPGRIADVLSVLRSAGLGDVFGGPGDAPVRYAGGADAGDGGADGNQAAIEARR